MHLLRTQPGGFVPDDSIADLGQTPAELVILCSGDSHLALLADTAEQLPEDYPSLRLANPMQVQNHASVDLYVDQVLRHAKVILVSLHGGVGYWRYGVEQLVELAGRGVQLILVPGDDRPDPELTSLGSVSGEQAERLWHYLRQGGKANAINLFNCLASQWLGRDYAWDEPQPLPRTAVYHPAKGSATLEDWYPQWHPEQPVAPLLFYRSHLQAANTAFIDVFCQRLQAAGLNPLPIAVASLKESACLEQVEGWLDEVGAEVLVNTTGFALSSPERPNLRPFRRDIPVLQAICAQDNQPGWEASEQGLGRVTWPCTLPCPNWTGASSPARSASRTWPGAASAASPTWSATALTPNAWTLSPSWPVAGSSWRACRMPRSAWPWCWPTTRPGMAA